MSSKIKLIEIIFFCAIVSILHAMQEKCIPAVLCVPATTAAMTAYTDEEDRIQFIQGFRYGYLESLIGQKYSSSLDTENSPFAKGFRTAKEEYKNKKEKKQPIRLYLGDFGYTRIEITGKIALGFERSHFTPEGQTNPWWVRLPYEVRQNLGQKYFELWKDGKVLSVKGWLSPEGGYGHFSICKRELIVYEITENK